MDSTFLKSPFSLFMVFYHFVLSLHLLLEVDPFQYNYKDRFCSGNALFGNPLTSLSETGPFWFKTVLYNRVKTATHSYNWAHGPGLTKGRMAYNVIENMAGPGHCPAHGPGAWVF